MRLSLVMPVHNAAGLLPAALDSVRSQSFADWELLCVSDGSTDGSDDILAASAARDPRIRFIRQENAGASAARNRALDAVTGDFFLFLDGDDLLMQGALAQIDAALRETDADALLTYPLYRTFAAETQPPPSAWTACLRIRETLPPGSRKRLVLDSDAPYGFVCGRVYRTALFGRLRFPTGLRMMEDLAFWSEALAVPARWSLVRGAFYAYRDHPGTVSRTRQASFYADVLSVPKDFFPKAADALDLSPAERRRAWHRFSGAYSGFLRSLFCQWETLPPEERNALLDRIAAWRRTFSFDPIPPFARLRLWCVRHRFGAGVWVNRIEDPLTRFLNTLRTLKRRILK